MLFGMRAGYIFSHAGRWLFEINGNESHRPTGALVQPRTCTREGSMLAKGPDPANRNIRRHMRARWDLVGRVACMLDARPAQCAREEVLSDG